MKTHVKIATSLSVICSLFALLLACTEKEKHANVAAIWQGWLNFPGFESRIVFQIERTNDDSLVAAMMKPDETEQRFPIDDIQINGAEISLSIASLNMSFQGRFDNSNETLSGEWRQGRWSQALVLTKVDSIIEPHRPQTPKPPFPYNTDEVIFKNEDGGSVLSGTLTHLKNESIATAVILITGGGEHDRDYSIARHKPFWVIADYLTRQGVAVLRFDERGVGASIGNRSGATIKDMAGDVLAGVKFLQSTPLLNVKKIGLLGHSEGGYIAELAALESSAIDFIITLGTPGLDGETYQLQFEESSGRVMGLDDARIKARLDFQQRVFDILKNESDMNTARNRLFELLGTITPSLPDERKNTSIEKFLSPWFRFNLNFDPAATLARLDCPVLALFGDKDLHVPPTDNVKAVEAALQKAGHSHSAVQVLPQMNHFFQTNKNNIYFQYGKITETISPKLLELLGDWIQNREEE